MGVGKYRAPHSRRPMTRWSSSAACPRRRILHGFATLGPGALAGCTTVFGGGEPADDGQSDLGSTPTGSIHWHVHLTIEVQGEPQPIPAAVGIGEQYADSRYYDRGMKMTSIHTHDESGTIHWEVMQTPKEGELRLGAFFDIWGKTFTETCIFDYCNDGDGEVTMTVNGEPNDEFADYVVSDEDEIVIRYG